MSDIPPALAGKAAVGLVMYHLGRIGLDFTLTLGNSGFGDIWAQCPSGKIGIEVKATRGNAHAFFVAPHQIEVVDYYAFIHIGSGVCYVATSDEVKGALRNQHRRGKRDLAIVSADNLPANCRHGWGKISGNPKDGGAVQLQDAAPRKIQLKTMIRQRADGSRWRVSYDRLNGGRVGNVERIG